MIEYNKLYNEKRLVENSFILLIFYFTFIYFKWYKIRNYLLTYNKINDII